MLNEYDSGTINKKMQVGSLIMQQKTVTRPLNTLYRRGIDNIKVRLISQISLVPSGNISDTLLIHIHGGGFISMSSQSHQCYTRLFE